MALKDQKLHWVPMVLYHPKVRKLPTVHWARKLHSVLTARWVLSRPKVQKLLTVRWVLSRLMVPRLLMVPMVH